MFKPFDFFTIAGQRRLLRIELFLLKWAMRLLSASVEICLRQNFGRRYMPMLFAAPFLFLFCAGLDPFRTPLTDLFWLGLFALAFWHFIYLFVRRSRSIAEPHSQSAGESWGGWQRFGFDETIVQRYLEPALCALVGCIIFLIDPFLGFWLMASGAALFVKQQISRFKTNRRIMDALDAKLEAQRLNAALTKAQQRPAQRAQKSHRAYFPRGGQHP